MFRKLLLFLLLFAAFVSTLSAQDGGLLTTTNNTVNFRAGPGVEWRILTELGTGTAIRLDGEAYEGSWVRGIVGDGTVGWVLSEYVAISPEQAAALPSIWVDAPFTLPAPDQVPVSAQAAAPPADNPATTDEQSVASLPQAAAPAPSGGLVATATARLNIRFGPSSEYVVVGALENGGQINVDGRSGNNLWVRGIDHRGQIGWVFAQYTSLTVAQVEALPIVTNDTPFALGAPGEAPAPQSQPQEETAITEPETAPVVNTAPVTGFSYGGHVAGFGADAEQWMRVAGMTWIKKQWRYVDGQGADAAGDMIADAHARGFRILIGVVGASPGDVTAGGYYDRYASFVGGLAALGADGIEVWNEPNIDREWPGGQIDPAQYTRLLQQAFTAIKNANSNTLVVSGAPAPTGFYGGCSGAGCDDNAFVSGMAAAGAARYMDCVGVHYNEGIVPPTATSGDPRGNSGHYTRYLSGMINVYSSAFGGRVPLCFTELGYLTPEGYGPLPPLFDWASNVTVAQQAAWLDGAVDLARRSGRVRLVIIWNIDFTGYDADPQAGYAIIRPGGGCPACNALGS